MFRKLLCWHNWGRWTYSRSRSEVKRKHMVRRACRKCGHIQYKEERSWFAF